jgi:transcriptional regulator with XRE-family HTH domain
VKRIEREESALLDALLKARQEAGLTQGQVAARMGTHAPAIARLERALASGKHSPSIATLRKYVKACGKRLVLRVAWEPLIHSIEQTMRRDFSSILIMELCRSV